MNRLIVCMVLALALSLSGEPDMRGGVHVNLHNNLYGTAFPQWYGENMRFRFTLRLS